MWDIFWRLTAREWRVEQGAQGRDGERDRTALQEPQRAGGLGNSVRVRSLCGLREGL